jgi:hypothetical protein
MTNVQLYPIWKEAVKKLIDGGLTYGSSVKRSYLIDLCGLEPPTRVEDVRKFDLDVLRCITDIKETLLTAHCMLLVSDHAGNYHVVAPDSQTEYAVESGIKAIGREMRRMSMNISFVKTELLNDQQRAKNADAQAKVSMLAGMIRNENKDLLRITSAR